MIHFLSTAEHRYTMDIFLAAETALSRSLIVLPYEAAIERQTLTPGAYIFADVDRLAGADLDAVIDLWSRLSELGPKVRLLNDPARALSRYELLRALYDDGTNGFTAWRVPDPLTADLPSALRFPVFLRDASEHTGRLTELLHDWSDVRNAALQLVGTPRVHTSGEYSSENLLIVEWCDTSDAAGVFRKYAAFVIGGEIVPRELVCSRDWLVKTFALFDETHLVEARRYLAENPHADFLREVARRAHIEYGRFDYSVLDGRPQIWEINTNPMILSYPPGERGVNVERLSIELHRVPLRRIAAALQALEPAPVGYTTDNPGARSGTVVST